MKREKNGPLIHCITNPISMTQCANTVLALGARPIMAEHPAEVKEITATAKALLLNLGNIADVRMQAMEIAFQEALSRDIPVVIDAVGVSCSRLRRDFLLSLLGKRANGSCLVIKGNYSEIMAMYDENYSSEGVDAAQGISMEEITRAAKELAYRFDAIILASGATDVVTDGVITNEVDRGCPELSMITGTGCMLGAICAALLAEEIDAGTTVSAGTDNTAIEAATQACRILGLAGERAAGPGIGAGTFLTRLLDNISLTPAERVTKDQLKLYLVTDSTGLSEEEFLTKVEDALKGGVTFLQIREKDRSTQEYIDLARKVHEISARYNVPLVVDDRVDVAMAIDAEGVHLGQSDMAVDAARKLLGDSKIIGATAKTVEQAKRAKEMGADYIGVGAIYPTTTKVKTIITSVDTLRDICEKVDIPANAIGGLNKDNIDVLKGVPISGICVVSAIMKAADSYRATRDLLSRMDELEIGKGNCP